jgi:hypothetical protein
MMIRGRHRGLPYQLDRSIMLPSERNNEIEDLQHAKRVDPVAEKSLKMRRFHTQ